MGNCLRHGSSSSSSVQWGGDDWGSSSARSGRGRDHDNDNDNYLHEGMKMVDQKEGEEGLILDDSDSFKASTTKTRMEVKIKITKKQLEELLGRAELKQLSVQQVLAQLMNVSDRYETHQRSWRPALQSIPEVN
ncbi:hypothetical protein ACOSQ3_030929 [Xanthoceras sorbifolium]